MRAGELRRLKDRVADYLGYAPKWYPDLEWSDGFTFADLDDGRTVSLMVTPTKGAPQIYGIEMTEPTERGRDWIETSHEQMAMLFS